MATDRAAVEGQYQVTANLEARIAIHERFSTNRIGLPRWLFAQMSLPLQALILEVGCGVGSFWSTNRDLIPPGWQMTLSDRSPAMVHEAARRIGPHPQFAFATADVAALPFPDASFDAVIAHFMLYHVSDLPRALAEIRRVLRPEGAFCAATNGMRHMREARRFAADVGLIGEELVEAGDGPEFDLEHGGAKLAPWFTEIRSRRYDDALLVTERDPLLAYIPLRHRGSGNARPARSAHGRAKGRRAAGGAGRTPHCRRRHPHYEGFRGFHRLEALSLAAKP